MSLRFLTAKRAFVVLHRLAAIEAQAQMPALHVGDCRRALVADLALAACIHFWVVHADVGGFDEKMDEMHIFLVFCCQVGNLLPKAA